MHWGVVMPSKKLCILIFDVKWQRDKNRLVYLETGSAPHSMLSATTRDKVWREIFTHYPDQPIYTDVADLPKPSDHTAAQKIVYVDSLVERIADGSFKKGVFLLHTAKNCMQANAYKKHLQLDGMHIINSQTILYCNNKIFFYEWCEISHVAFPQTWLLSRDSFAAQQHLLPKTFPQGCVIKPQDCAMGKGAAYVDEQQLPAVLAYLNDRTKPNPLANEPRFTLFWGEQSQKHQHWPYMLQEMVSGKNEHGVESTFRLVVSLTVDDLGNIEQFKMLDIIEKSPLPGTQKSSATVISLTDEMAGFYEYKGSFLRVLATGEPLYQAIARVAKQDITKLMCSCATINPSHLWQRKAHTLPVPNDYMTYMMPRIEMSKLEPYDDETLESFKTLLLSPIKLHRERLLIPFEFGYLGKTGRKLPAFARTHNLFQLMVNFIVREQESDLLIELHEMAENCFLEQYANIESKTPEEQEFCARVKYIVQLLESRLAVLVPHAFDAPTTPILTLFYGPWSHVGYFPVSSSCAYLIFDFKWQAKGNRIVYLEAGSAFHSRLQQETVEKIWDHLFRRFPNKTIYCDQGEASALQLRPQKYQNDNRIVPIDGNVITKLRDGEITTGVILLSEAKKIQQAHQFVAHHRLSNDIIIVNANLALYYENKIAFGELCQRAEIPHPTTQVLSRQTYHGTEAEINFDSPKGFIIKPPASSSGQGVAFARNKADAKKILDYAIGDDSKLQGEPFRFYAYWNHVIESIESAQIPCLVQERISSKNADGIETTFRAVVAIEADAQGNLMTFELFDIAEKFPMEVSEKFPENSTRTIVSLTQYAADDENYTKPFMQILDPHDERYQLIAECFKKDMKKFISHAMCVNPSSLWMERAGDVTQANDYVSYLMPLIEQTHYGIYDDETLMKFSQILLNGPRFHRTQLLDLFKYGYFGEKNNPLPDYARTKSLYHFIMYFVLTESSAKNLDALLTDMDNALKTGITLRKKLGENPSDMQKAFLLDDATQGDLKIIIDVVTDRLECLESMMSGESPKAPNSKSIEALTAARNYLTRSFDEYSAVKQIRAPKPK